MELQAMCLHFDLIHIYRYGKYAFSIFFLTFSCFNIISILFTWWDLEQLHDSIQQSMNYLKAWIFVIINSTEMPVVSCTYIWREGGERERRLQTCKCCILNIFLVQLYITIYLYRYPDHL